MESKIIYLIMKNTAKLEKLIETNAPYEKILKQSKNAKVEDKLRCKEEIHIHRYW